MKTLAAHETLPMRLPPRPSASLTHRLLLGVVSLVAAGGFFVATIQLIGWLMPPPAHAAATVVVGGR